jgi:excisionase family DNA binding protein
MLKNGEPLVDGIRRIALERIDKALGQLTDPAFNRDKAVHDARKTCKRLRSVLRLIRDEVGYDYYRRENLRFRDASRLLAPARDSAVMVETLDSLIERFQEPNSAQLPVDFLSDFEFPVEPNEFCDLRDQLVERHHAQSRQVLETDAVQQYIAAVREARLNVAIWPIQQDDFAAISGGLHRVYKRGCVRMARARKETNAEALHDWRKRVKYLWYQLEVIQPIWPTMLTELAESLHTLSSLLGDEHDLAELQLLILQNPDLLPNKLMQQRLFDMIAYRRQEFQTAAWPLGQRLYAETPAVFVKRMYAYWRSWRIESPVQKAKTTLPTSSNLNDGLFTTRQAADALTISPTEVRQMIRNGRLPAFKLGRNWLILGKNSQTMPENVQLVSTRQAAAQLNLRTQDIRKLIHAKKLPASKIGNHWGLNATNLRNYQREKENGVP